ncbi:hypothetical protein Tco_0641834 [Tanacetum coccineum]
MAPVPPRDQRHLWLRYQVKGYTKEIVHDFEQRLESIFDRQVNRVHILDFLGIDPRYEAGFGREDEDGLHTAEEMAEDGFGVYWLGSERLIPDKGDLSDYWVKISFGMDFLRGAPSYTYIRNPVRRLCYRLISYNISGRGQAPKKVTATDIFYLRRMDREAVNVSYLLAYYLFRHTKGRKSGARLSGAPRPERQQVVVAGAPTVVDDAPAVDEGDQAVSAPVQAP